MRLESSRMLPAIRVAQVGGLEYLALVTRLLQRAHQMDPTGGLWEAADFHWWWRRDQHGDPARQTFWLVGDTPVAAVVLMNWGNHLQCDPIFTPEYRGALEDVV